MGDVMMWGVGGLCAICVLAFAVGAAIDEINWYRYLKQDKKKGEDQDEGDK